MRRSVIGFFLNLSVFVLNAWYRYYESRRFDMVPFTTMLQNDDLINAETRWTLYTRIKDLNCKNVSTYIT